MHMPLQLVVELITKALVIRPERPHSGTLNSGPDVERLKYN